MAREEKKHTPEGAAFTELVMAIFASHGRLVREGDALASDLGLTSVRWRVLALVARQSLTVAQLARRFEITRQSMLWVVTALAEDNFVRLVDNPDHKRSKRVELTELGSDTYKGMQVRQIAWANATAAEFRLDELHSALSVVERISREPLAESIVQGK